MRGFAFGSLNGREYGDESYSSARMKDVERLFGVVQTGKDPNHHTVVLPKPVDSKVAKEFNKVFGRVK